MPPLATGFRPPRRSCSGSAPACSSPARSLSGRRAATPPPKAFSNSTSIFPGIPGRRRRVSTASPADRGLYSTPTNVGVSRRDCSNRARVWAVTPKVYAAQVLPTRQSGRPAASQAAAAPAGGPGSGSGPRAARAPRHDAALPYGALSDFVLGAVQYLPPSPTAHCPISYLALSNVRGSCSGTKVFTATVR